MLQRRLLDKFGSAKNIYNASAENFLGISGIGKAKIENIQNARSLDEAGIILDNCSRQGVGIMTYKDSVYREKAAALPDMPILLYYKGEVRQMKHYIGVIGSRRCTQDGKHKTVELVNRIWTPKIAIVSGMAKGIDSYASTACLNCGGYTIAVLGNGVDICYPSENKPLWNKIVENGLLISEYEPGTPPRVYQFPRRNRIIAAFSDEIYIPEMGKISGARHTLEYAKNYNRKIIIL